MRHSFILFLLLAVFPLFGDEACSRPAAGVSVGLSDRPAVETASREDIAIFKGRVALSAETGHYRLVSCGTAEWLSCDDVTPLELGVSDLQMIVWATRNTTILIYGKWDDSPLAVDCFLDVDTVKVTASCEELPAERSSWGGLKASYR